MKAFKNAKVYVEGEGLVKTDVYFDEYITSIGASDAEAEVITLPDDAVVLPGFIDEHIHGAGGCDAMDGTVEALATIADTVAKEGTTTFLATTMTQSPENITKALTAVKEYIESDRLEGARILGVHLEGPFINAAFKGAQPGEYIATPDADVFSTYDEASGQNIHIVTLAPEIEGADDFITYLDSIGVIVSIGHTKATSADVRRAIRNGARHTTHTYNAQSPLHHREIGVVGSAMLYDDLRSEVIADTIHVSVPALQLLAKCKPADKLILITDAMRAKGLGEGVSELGGQTVIVKNGEARLEDGTLAGSVLLMNRAIQNMVEKVGVPFLTAVDYATANPAKALGIYESVGSISENKTADFTVLNSAYDVILTVREGKIIYQA